MRRLGPLVLEERPDPPWHAVLGVSLGAIAAAFVAGGVVFWAYGVHPVQAYGVILAGTVGDVRGWAEVVRRATPLLLIGVGLVLAIRARFWNIGAEGQLLAGAAAAGGVALFVPLPDVLVLPAMFVVAIVAGALWGLVPAQLKVRLGVNEVITTLMMNYIATTIVDWLIHGPWKGRTVWGFPYSDTFPDAAWLPVIATTQVHWPTLVAGLTLAAVTAFLLGRTRFGHEVRVLGHNPEAGRYAGIDPARTAARVMLISAGAAGLAGLGEVAGIHHRLLGPTQISLGYGYTGIIVALLARGNPLATILSALLMGFIFASGDVMKVALQLPFQTTNILNGLVLFFVIGSEPLMRYRIRWASSSRQGLEEASAQGAEAAPPGEAQEATAWNRQTGSSGR